MKNREAYLLNASNEMQALARELRRYTADNLTTKEYTAIVEIREVCNRIIEEELCK